MKTPSKRSSKLLCLGLAAVTGLTAVGTAYADSDWRSGRQRHEERGRHDDHDRPVLHRGHGYPVRPDTVRRYRNVIVVRPYGHRYSGYGHYHRDADAYRWLGLTAITLALLNNLNESQQRAYEEAQIRATTAPVGESIIWNSQGATGSVTALREGTSTAGRYCREFQQTVTIGGRQEQAYGTACRQADGNWEVVSTDSQP